MTSTCQRFTLVFVFTLLLIATVSGKTIEMPDAQIQVQVPTNWITEKEGPGWNIKSPDGGSVAMAFVILENPDLEAAVNEAEKSINEAIGQLTLSGETIEGELNGLKFVEQQASAMEGQVSVSLTLILTPTQKWLLVAYFGAIEKEAVWQTDVNNIASSLKPSEKSAKAPGAKDSFPMPFASNKALALLCAPPSPEGESQWQPDPQSFAAAAKVNGKALTRAIGFNAYDYDETTTQVLFLYKSSFPLTKEPFFQSIIGAALFNCKNGVCTPIWNNPALILFGDYENETATRFVNIGQGCHGAIIEGGETHQGITLTNAVLLAIHQNRVVVAAKDLPVYEDNEGTTDDPAKHYRFSTSINFEPGAHSRYYNMKVTFKGTTLEEQEKAGKMLSQVVPADFTRSFFWDDNGFYEEEIECGD